MKKQKLNAKLDLNKQKVSRLEATNVVGGLVARETIMFQDCISSWDFDCIYSLGKDDMMNNR